ncbi:NADH-quinone oxidoreductase subunit I [Sphaerochaeta globosa]|uniref:4Fe-4S ferredoxin iron-sulfur binding domain-containing protein n=1 Tax=Sphaerochaeta globosa (strain ATCC BAA-1886 / DSM 22777 / Buddy) TaxID=158189 RepID=F0RVF0_SPHGB|nr:4Fe-4S binding protein [Sphaerochaeta globosa]ADY12942.1 4Fe-4S ferredoxin iron-sulfur binding domain-containing protein [Sphaerochaeta globosa str. Buddy]
MDYQNDTEGRLKTTGAASLAELHATKEYILPDERMKHPVAVIECIEAIPCNPCETACPVHAITVGSEITNLPVIDIEKCTGCGLCVAACPGLAIYLKQKNYTTDLSFIAFPFEYVPLPEAGQTVNMVNRYGQVVCEGTVIKVVTIKRFNRTAIIHASYPVKQYEHVVNMQRLARN